MAYTTIKKPSDYFNTKLYTGSNSTQSVTGVGFQPDLVWIKNRTLTPDHILNDAVRTAGKQINSNTASAELDRTYFQSFNSDGFSLDGNVSDYNQSGSNYASWNWLANGAGSANTDGSISSTVSANTTSGFSIVSYTGTGANATVGHGLGSTADVLIVKSRDGAHNWQVLHKSLATNSGTKNLELNSTSAVLTDSTTWNNTAPTSSVFSVGATNPTNQSGQNLIAYCFAEKKGFSKFGSYVGNGNADGTFVYTGFKPAFVMSKRTDSAGNSWRMFDNKREGYNGSMGIIHANLSNVESIASTIDFLSNGFKIRATTTDQNASGATYIYMTFAEEPLVGDNPATAR